MSDTPLPVDVLVGQNIRLCRLQKGLSQTELGEALGVTFQQVQKYEKGANRVGAGRLMQIASVLEVALPSLFEGAATAAEPAQRSNGALLTQPHALRLVQGFEKIKDDHLRLAILSLVERLAE